MTTTPPLFSTIQSLPLEYTLPLPLFLLFLTTYTLGSPYFSTEKQRAYVLSTLSSCFMSIISIPFMVSYCLYGLEYVYELSQEGWMRVLTKVGIVFFGMYLFSDLAIGHFKYPSQVGLLTGWIHHICYIALMIYASTSPLAFIFMTCAIMELPTFDLALSNLFPQVRNDLRFLSTFFALRIVFNIIYLIDISRPSSRAMMGDNWIPSIMGTLALILHISWFKGGLTGYLKRQRKAKSSSMSNKSPLITKPTKSISPDRKAKSSNDYLDVPTPEDSPLITPYTPGTTPMSLRDSYLFNTLTIPSIGSIPPLPALPALPKPLHALTSGIAGALDVRIQEMGMGMGMGGMGEFKDAVKLRWEENRDMFSLEGWRGGMRLNMNGLNGLGIIRKRQGAPGAGKGDTEVVVEEADLSE